LFSAAANLTPVSPLPPARMLSMNRLDYNRLALSPESPTSSKTPRLPPPLRGSALKFTASTLSHPSACATAPKSPNSTTDDNRRGCSPETHPQAFVFRRRQSYSGLSASSRPDALDESPGLQSPGPFTGISDLLKNSASSSASPRLRVEIHSLDPSAPLRLRNRTQVPQLYDRQPQTARAPRFE
jgi:hypothetical protein